MPHYRRETKFMVAGFLIAWILSGAWFVVNGFFHPSIRIGLLFETITVALWPSSIALMATGDKLLPQLATIFFASIINAGWYWLIGKFFLWMGGRPPSPPS
jgi:hypothetical protein